MKSKIALFILFILITLIFIDANMIKVPVKLIVGRPMMVPLGRLIILSMAAGAMLPAAGYMVLRKKNKE